MSLLAENSLRFSRSKYFWNINFFFFFFFVKHNGNVNVTKNQGCYHLDNVEEYHYRDM